MVDVIQLKPGFVALSRKAAARGVFVSPCRGARCGEIGEAREGLCPPTLSHPIPRPAPSTNGRMNRPAPPLLPEAAGRRNDGAEDTVFGVAGLMGTVDRAACRVAARAGVAWRECWWVSCLAQLTHSLLHPLVFAERLLPTIVPAIARGAFCISLSARAGRGRQYFDTSCSTRGRGSEKEGNERKREGVRMV